MALKNLLLFLVLALCLMAQATAARNLADQATDCVKALGEFVSCTNLTVQFFLIGKADIANCCRAIDDIIKSKCNWPAPLISLGYTPEQISNMLKAYCDAIASSLSVPTPLTLGLFNAKIIIHSNTTISASTEITIPQSTS